MAMRQIITSAGRGKKTESRGLERIPGTDKVRTYCANASQYSRESDLVKITSKQYRAVGAKKKI